MKPSYSHQALILAAVTFFSSAYVSAQPETPLNKGGISMKSVEGLNQSGTGAVLVGGREARTADWPASFYSATVGARCSATLIGPQTLLLAAHCVGDKQDVAIDFRDKVITGKCTHASDFRSGTGDRSADYALCKLADEISGIQFERLNRDPTKIILQDKLLLTGYGCTKLPPPGGGPPTGGNDGKFRIGKAKIVSLPGTEAGDINTVKTKDQVVVCLGDSGGGSYIELPAHRRILVSVTSRVTYTDRVSYLSSVTTTAALAFFEKWISENENEKICGINFNQRCK